MTIKTINNRNAMIGVIIGYSLLILFLSIGFFLKQGSIAILIIGFVLVSLVAYLVLKSIKTTVYSEEGTIVKSIFQQAEHFDLKNHRIVLQRNGGSRYLTTNSISLWIDNQKITVFSLNNFEWEFEEFYHKTILAGYTWKIHDSVRSEHEKNYERYLKIRS